MENFSYQSIPFHYLHCLNPSCARSASYLHRLTVRHVPAEMTHVMAVNPVSYPVEVNRCAYFRGAEKQCCARDISNLFDNIPCKKAVYLKRKMYDLYPHTICYHILHQERALSPGEREEVAALFLQTDIDEVPVSNRCTDECSWDEQRTPKGSAAP